MKKIPSFTIDHIRLLRGIYVSRKDEVNGEVITTFDIHTPQWNLGVFHESNFELTDRLTATIGLRYDFMHTAIHYASSAYMAMTANVMGQVATNTLRSVLDHETSDNYHQVLPKIGINWKIDAQGSNVYTNGCPLSSYPRVQRQTARPSLPWASSIPVPVSPKTLV